MSRVRDANSLTQKQEAFIHAYLETGNASEAYRRAYDCSRMTEKSINENASKALRHAKIAPRLAEAQAQAAERNEITVDWLVQQYKQIAQADIRDMLEWDADGEIKLKDSKSLPKRVSAAIAEVSKSRNGFKFKMHDKQTALQALGRHVGMFKDILEHTGKDGGPIETKELSDMEAARRIAFMLGRAVGRGDRAAADPEKHEEQAA